MIRRCLLGLALVALAGVASATDSPLDQITVDNTAGGVGFTASKYAPNGVTNQPQAILATCRARTAQISFVTSSLDTVTTTVGQILEIDEWLYVTGYDRIRAFRAIRTGGTSGQLDCRYTFPSS